MNRQEILEHVGKLISDSRNKTHGDPNRQFALAQALKDTLHSGTTWVDCPPQVREALESICTKLSRIVSGDPTHRDHYDDIAGYAGIAAGYMDTPAYKGKKRK